MTATILDAACSYAADASVDGERAFAVGGQLMPIDGGYVAR